jgi:hypothetical protein
LAVLIGVGVAPIITGVLIVAAGSRLEAPQIGVAGWG